jgi:hypothetical protein
MLHIRALCHTKTKITKSILSSFVENLLHVSTSLDHLQGEQFLYTRVALIQLSDNVPLASHYFEREVWTLRETIFPEDDPAGSKHVGGFLRMKIIYFLCISWWFLFLYMWELVYEGRWRWKLRKRTRIVFESAELCAERLPSISSAETKPRWSQI